MKSIVTTLFIVLSLALSSQNINKSNKEISSEDKTVSFKAKIGKENATKEGVYVKGYLVNVQYDKAKKLIGKKVKITGEIKTIKGFQNQAILYDENGNVAQVQSRSKDIKYIESPIILVLN